MYIKHLFAIALLTLAITLTATAPVGTATSAAMTDSVAADTIVAVDTIAIADTLVSADTVTAPKSMTLTEDDYREVAERLGVEVAAIKAVVEIEAGRAHQGFFEPGKPIINFDITIYRQFARRNGINLAKYTGTHADIFRRPNARKHGSQQAAQYHRFQLACSIDTATAIQGAFWGMFQLGGFNWKLCGAESAQHFLEIMSRSERDQLDLFATFITKTGLVKYLKAKNWSQFAYRYNGPSYAQRGYHTKMARAYARHRK